MVLGMPHVRIGTRYSPLALHQAEQVATALEALDPAVTSELVKVTTSGDQWMGDLAKLGGKGAFVREIDRNLLDGSVDLAVHCLKDIPGDIPAPEGLAFSHDNKTLVSTGHDGSTRLWNVATGNETAKIAPSPLATSRVAFTKDGKTLIVTGGSNSNGQISYYNADTRQLLRQFSAHKGGVLCVAFAQNTSTVYSTARSPGGGVDGGGILRERDAHGEEQEDGAHGLILYYRLWPWYHSTIEVEPAPF